MKFQKMMMTDDVIIDVGASNVEDFLDGMFKFEESHEEFDYFVIPVTSGTKEQRETISIIGTLSGLGVPANKILVLFNRAFCKELATKKHLTITFSGNTAHTKP